MKKRLAFLLGYLCMWLLFFIFFKIIFLIYHADQSSELAFPFILGIFKHGFRLDLSFSSYISAIPFLLISLSVLFPIKFIRPVIKYYTIFVAILITLLCVIDLELFKAWGFRLDATPLIYLDTPNEMWASAGASPIALLLFILLVVAGLFIFSYIKWLDPIISLTKKVSFLTFPFFLLISASLIIPIRGGLQLAPLNVSDAYFSNNNFANQAAINVPWNFFNAVSRKTYDKTNPYVFMEEDVAKEILSEHLNMGDANNVSVLRTTRPNVLLIIWESLTAKAVETLGGVKGITPNFDQLTKEGILFTNFYASGDRSDKGIVGILSGYPAQPTQSIIKLPSKAAKLPSLSKSFAAAGYNTSFYYGGELEFANIKAYLVSGGFNNIIGKDSFSSKDWNSKWGAHDHVVFDKILADMHEQPTPFFTTVFTLSSHEPFEVPMESHIKGSDEESLFLNALYYTDQSLGDFIQQLKRMPFYDETLVIILADHGHRMPLSSRNHEKEKFHIPMLWLGGALIPKDSVISTYSSQTDLAATLLTQLELPTAAYEWSRNILSPGTNPFAHYVFNDGFGHVSNNGYEVFDNISKKFIIGDASLDADEAKFSKAYLQLSYQDFLDK